MRVVTCDFVVVMFRGVHEFMNTISTVGLRRSPFDDYLCRYGSEGVDAWA